MKSLLFMSIPVSTGININWSAKYSPINFRPSNLFKIFLFFKIIFATILFAAGLSVNKTYAQIKSTSENKTVSIYSSNTMPNESIYNTWIASISNVKNWKSNLVTDNDADFGENPNIPHDLPFFTGGCYPGTGNRFSGSYHSNLYIGNNNGSNVLVEWGQNMKLYTTGAGTNDTTPVIVSAASYAGVPLEVKSSSSGGAAGNSALVLRTSTKLYFFGTAANITAITTMAGFGGASLIAAASDVTAKLPSWISVSNISQMVISQTAFAIVTADSGRVYVLAAGTVGAYLQGDSATANAAIWHQVKLSGGTTPLSGVKKISLSSSGAFALDSTGKVYYWGAPANVAGVANTSTYYKCAYNMSAQIPSGKTVKDLVCLGTKTPSSSTLFLLCTDGHVYSCGLNTNGALGINNSTYTTNQPTFTAVLDTLGATALPKIDRIDGDTEADIFCMAALDSNGVIYGWGDSPAAMLGLPLTGASTSSYPVPKTVRLFNSGSAPGSGYTDFSVAGHFTIAFYYNSGTSTDQYWYLGHNIGGSIGDPTNNTTYIVENAPANLTAPSGISFSCNGALPIELLSFTGRASGSNVLLNWSTASEQNTKNFLVQHSTDGTSWKNIGSVTAAYYSMVTENYDYTDANPAKGINFYRLIQRDMDGNFTYSNIVNVVFKGATTPLIVYPNPVVNGRLNVQLNEANPVNLYNSIGMLVLTKQFQAGTQQIDVSNLSKGIYQLKAGTQTVKFLIQ